MVEEKNVTLSGKKVHYYIDETEQPELDVIFLHGKSFKAQTWIDIKPWNHLSPLGIRGIYVDIPGWGESEENSKYNVYERDYASMSRFLFDFSTHIGLSKYVALGASFSVPFVLRHAIDYPDRVKKLVLVGGVFAIGIKDEIGKIKQPTLIIYGKNDTVVGLEPAENYASLLSNSKKVIVEGARHPLYLDKPVEFFEILKDFLKN